MLIPSRNSGSLRGASAARPLLTPHQSAAEADFYRARAAIEQAVAIGRLSEYALREAARRNALLRRTPRDPSVGRWPGVEGAGAARAELALLGRRVAGASLRSRGDVRLRRVPVVFDVRRRVSYASGNLGNPLLSAFAAEGIEAVPGAAGEEISEGSQAIVLTRNPVSDPQGSALAASSPRTRRARRPRRGDERCSRGDEPHRDARDRGCQRRRRGEPDGQ